MTKGVQMILEERERQIQSEGFDNSHDSQHMNGELALAACCYAAPVPLFARVISSYKDRKKKICTMSYEDPWPWSKEWDKRSQHDQIRKLQIAGALIAAELDRLTTGGGK